MRQGRPPPRARLPTPAVARVLSVVCCWLLLAGPLPATATAAAQIPAEPPQPPLVSARGAVLWDPYDDRVLYGKEETVARPMASTTKIMTVLLALEAGAVEDQLTVSADAADQGGASLGLRPGQVIPMRSILAGLMLRSGNDAAVALAQHLAGTEPAFVERMNARAAELGLTSTQFVNASGLTDDPNHRASPLDLARLAQVAMAHPVFAEYAAAARLTVPGLAPMESRNELLWRYPGATGVKTGFTTLAGLCLVASADRDGRTLYVVLLDSDDSFVDAAALLDYGFEAFRRPTLLEQDAEAVRYRWADAEVAAVAAETLTATVPVTATVTWRTVLAPVTVRPVQAGTALGAAELVVDGAVVTRVELRALDGVAPARPASAAAAAGGALQEAVRAFIRLHPVDRPVPVG
jgi:serine-type D-Ala-D-Ala carboxypeptidase (penicillin-binding protein 5/6)